MAQRNGKERDYIDVIHLETVTLCLYGMQNECQKTDRRASCKQHNNV